MTWLAWVFVALVLAAGAIYDGIADQVAVSASSSTAAAGINAMQSGTEIVIIDDAELSSGPLNTGMGIPAVFNIGTWGTIFDALTFNHSFLTGHWKIVQYLMQAVGSGLLVYTAMSMASGFLGSIRGVTRAGV